LWFHLALVIKNIENAKKYLSESWYEDLQTIIKDNKSKEPKYGTPKDCTTGILEDSKELLYQDNLVIFFSQLYHHLIRNISFCTD
jgi:hypothetical protein